MKNSKEKKVIGKVHDTYNKYNIYNNKYNNINNIEKKNKQKAKISSSKKMIVYLFASCTVIQIATLYFMYLMLQNSAVTGLLDFSPLTTLISSIVGEVAAYAVYSNKAKAENILKIQSGSDNNEDETPVG